MVDLKIYLTSLQPDMGQSIYSQSIGGYVSTSLLYPETTVSGTIGLYDTSFTLNTPDGGWSSWSNIEYININNEIIKISPIITGSVIVEQRGFNSIVEMHINGDITKGVSGIELFNDVFNDDYKQYRCIAVKNVSIPDPSVFSVANNVSVYLRQGSRNLNSLVKIAVEKPISQYINSFANNIVSNISLDSSQLVDSSLIGRYDENYFINSYLKIKSGTNNGQGRVVSSFDASTGTFTLVNTLLVDTNVSYEVLPAPAQRIKSGTNSPNILESNITSFVSADQNNPLSIDFNEQDNASVTSSSLNVNDVFYIWLERTIDKGSSSFDNNDIIINIEYTAIG